ncbi:hypothetical protein [Thermaerobacter subterraneus]|uniref:Uncharacterized protein n=1 Tax=Thermaerobacter subterraneus DSM 13965 TaxID=867903 RepID=K6Q0R3_9FIRM|nr:hypothetical protein [Thermaerobacter subterraneus]EKP94479.1 hypothetical protein ThesuDRAFT_02216 [Thermaerobacter subterraneus DSM 13965]
MTAVVNATQTIEGGDTMLTEEAVRQFVMDSVAFHAQEREEAQRRLVDFLKTCRSQEEAREKALWEQVAREPDPDRRANLLYSIGNAEGAASAFRFVIDLLEGNLDVEEE